MLHQSRRQVAYVQPVERGNHEPVVFFAGAARVSGATTTDHIGDKATVVCFRLKLWAPYNLPISAIARTLMPLIDFPSGSPPQPASVCTCTAPAGAIFKTSSLKMCPFAVIILDTPFK